jgi:transposase
MTGPIAAKLPVLKANRTFNPTAERVRDPLFRDSLFFDPRDRLQVKYEMLRRVRVEGWSVNRAAAAMGYSRPAFYDAQRAFEQQGLSGLVPRKRGPTTGHKLTAEVMAFVQAALIEAPDLSAPVLARRLAQRFGLSVHPRSIERALQRLAKKKTRAR